MPWGDSYDCGYAARTRRDPLNRSHHTRAQQVDRAVKAAYRSIYADGWVAMTLAAHHGTVLPFEAVAVLRAWRAQHGD